MTNEEAKTIIRKEYLCVDRDCDIERSCGKCDLMMPSKEPILEAYKMAMDALAIPSAEPKTGHWIYDRTRDWDGECKYECSECGMGSDVDYDYCMRCGARMVEPQERSEE